MGFGERTWRQANNATFYTSATDLSATGDTGVIAAPLASSEGPLIIPLYFTLVGNGMATDETNIVTMLWYSESTGASTNLIGTTTFTQLTAANQVYAEAWPGDVTFFNVARDFIPLFPYVKIVWTLAGTTKSMGFTLYMSYITFG